VRRQANGTVQGFVNDTLVASFNGTTANARGTEYGMAASGSGGRFDDFSVD